MKKFIIAAILVLTTVITALSFNKDNAAKESTIKIEEVKVSGMDHSGPKMDISTID